MTIKYDVFLNIIVIVFIFCMSLYIGSYYVNGDQLHYIAFYNAIPFISSYTNLLHIYRAMLSSNAYSYLFIMYFFANIGLNHLLVVAILNSLLAYSMLLLFQTWKVNKFVYIIFIVTNFYILVLFFAAERLKVGFLFFIFSMLYYKKPLKFIFFTSLSIMGHAQMVILYSAIFFEKVANKFFKYKNIKFNWRIFLSIIIVIFSLLAMSKQIEIKLHSYNNVYGVEGYYKSIIFLFMALWYSNNKRETIFIFLPLFFAIYFVGDIRINMFSYFIFLYYALRVKNGLNFGILITSLYFLMESIIFLYKIFTYGNGFT